MRPLAKNIRKVRAIPYEPSAPTEVNPKWVEKKMIANNIKLKEIEQDTGIDYTRLSALISGNRPMSQIVQAMFYFYFAAKEAVEA